ncbi:DNA binding protein [Vibrio phage vB_VpaS_VP-RY-9]|nr:DNA binding protein [Vibrio phage vB_VpaS_VP-RY-9]
MGDCKTWYDKNKKEHNAKRRSRYHTDPEYREKVQERARERARKLREERKGEIPRIYRVVNGKEIEVFKHSDIANDCGVTTRQMKNDEANGIIPRMTFEGRNRVYSAEQRDLLVAFYNQDISSKQLFAQWG